jgi:hypothetical protein
MRYYVTLASNAPPRAFIEAGDTPQPDDPALVIIGVMRVDNEVSTKSARGPAEVHGTPHAVVEEDATRVSVT